MHDYLPFLRVLTKAAASDSDPLKKRRRLFPTQERTTRLRNQARCHARSGSNREPSPRLYPEIANSPRSRFCGRAPPRGGAAARWSLPAWPRSVFIGAVDLLLDPDTGATRASDAPNCGIRQIRVDANFCKLF